MTPSSTPTTDHTPTRWGQIKRARWGQIKLTFPLDIVFVPDGYDALVSNANEAALGEQMVLVISVPTWVSLKEASGRSKDLEHLDRFHADGPSSSR